MVNTLNTSTLVVFPLNRFAAGAVIEFLELQNHCKKLQKITIIYNQLLYRSVQVLV